MARKGWSAYDEMIRSSPNLWHVHRDARGVTALTTSTKPFTREDVIESYLIPCQRLDREPDGKFVQVDFCWTRQEAERKAGLFFTTHQDEAAA